MTLICGSVKLWSGNLHTLALLSSGSRSFPLSLLGEVIYAKVSGLVSFQVNSA